MNREPRRPAQESPSRRLNRLLERSRIQIPWGCCVCSFTLQMNMKSRLLKSNRSTAHGSVRRCLLALLALLFNAAVAFAQGAGEPTGDVRNVHDPAVIEEAGRFYLFSTRAGIAVRCSEDLVRWRLCGDVFGHLPQWAVEDVQGLRGLWAAGIAYFDGRYTLY